MYLLSTPPNYTSFDTWFQSIQNRNIGDKELFLKSCRISKLINSPSTIAIDWTIDIRVRLVTILSQLDFDQDTLIAALLYAAKSMELLKSDNNEFIEFSKNIQMLVQGIDRMNLIDQMSTRQKYSSIQLNNFHKMIVSIIDDPRVVVIKLAEQLYFLQLAVHKYDDNQKLAKRIIDFYIPLANRLGIGQIKSELENLTFKILEPYSYQQIAESLEKKKLESEKTINEIIETLNNKIKKLSFSNFEIRGRIKHIYSIYRKMHKKNINFNELSDIIAVRVIVPTIKNCYETLSTVYEIWEHIPEEYDDYIYSPKSNGYQSLHTAVIGPKNQTFEIQIRTFQMHEDAELGTAAHWRYKEGEAINNLNERKMVWLRQVLEWKNYLSNELTVYQNKDDKIYVFTPKGEIKILPSGSTPLDFAYHIHTKIGHRCKGAKVNGQITSLSYKLNTGDQIEILTGSRELPSRDWLIPKNAYVITNRAKSKIAHWFLSKESTNLKEKGLERFEEIIKKLKLANANIEKISRQLHFRSSDEFLIALSNGNIKPISIAELFQKNTVKKLKKAPLQSSNATNYNTNFGLKGINNILTHISKCCNPTPEDKIVGFITKGRGIYIHKIDCPNILKKSSEQKNRIIKITKEDQNNSMQNNTLEIIANFRNDLINEISDFLVKEGVEIYSFVTKPLQNLQIKILIEANSIQNMKMFHSKLLSIDNIISVNFIK